LEPTISIIVTPARDSDGRKAHSSRGQLFNGYVADRLAISRSTQPMLDGARMLLAQGADPSTPVAMRHQGDQDTLKSTIGAAARLTVAEGERRPTFRANSGRSRPPFRFEAAHHTGMKPPTVPT
jgi:hypothetical protein